VERVRFSVAAPFVLLAALAPDAARGQEAASPLARAQRLYAKRDARESTRRAFVEAWQPVTIESGDWQLLTAFSYRGHRRHDLAPPRAPEAELLALRAGDAGPDLTRTFEGKDGLVAKWEPIGKGIDRRIDLRRLGDGRDDLTVAYLHGTLIAPAAGTLEAAIGSDDGLMLWLNGKLLVDLDVPRSLVPPFDRVKLALAAGVNHVVAKVANGYADFAFEMDTRPALPGEVDAWLGWRLDQDFPRDRARMHWRTLSVHVPEETELEVGGLDVLPDGRVVAATRRGDVWIIAGADQEPPVAPRFAKFASGLHEPLGAAARVEDGKLAVWVVQRPELTRLVDQDGDGRADLYDAVCDAWGVSGNYHEFAFGPKFDRDGNAWVTLNVGFCGSLGKSEVPWRGWALKVTPAREFVPVCAGARSPNGIGFDGEGEALYVDNQGDWVETNVLRLLAPGEYLGHPAGLRWRSDLQKDEHGAPAIPPPSPPIVWFPYEKMGQSTADIVRIATGGKFGPFEGQLLCGELTLARVLRVDLERVDGRLQGACFPFLDGFESGVNRLAFAPDGSLYVGETDRGWGSVGRKRFGLERVAWNGTMPCELLRMRAEPDGFRLEFTRPVDPASATDVASYRLSSFHYEHHQEYGCPEMETRAHVLSSAELIDAKTVRLRVDAAAGALRPGCVHELHLDGVKSGASSDGAEPAGSPLLHAVAWYTLNEAPATDAQ
jgi:glucose/arabinose dehydrogenase